MPIYGNFTGAEENHLFDKKLETNVHRKKYIQALAHLIQLHSEVGILKSSLNSRVSSTHAWFLHALGAHKH